MFAVTTVIFQSGYECRNYTDLWYCTNKKRYYITLFYYDTIDLY
jgi:hypothetical protein